MKISANSDGTEDEDLECGNEEESNSPEENESHILHGDEDENVEDEDDENGDTGPVFYMERDIDDEMSPNADVLNDDELRPSHKQQACSGLPTSCKGYD